MWRRRKYWSRRKFCRDMCIYASKSINEIFNDLTRKVLHG